MNKSNTDTRRVRILLVALIATTAAVSAYMRAEADDGFKGTKKGDRGTDLVIKDAKPIEYFDGKRINKKLARKIAKGKGTLLAWAGCPKLDEYDCMTITTGTDTKFTVYVVVDKKCNKAKGKKSMAKRRATCIGGYGLVSKAQVTSSGWYETTYQTNSGQTRTKRTIDTTTKLYVAASGKNKITRMKLFTRTEQQLTIFSSSHWDVQYSIYNADGSVFEDKDLCPPDGTCENLGYTRIASSGDSSIRQCDTKYGDGGTQDLAVDGGGDIIIKITTGIGLAGGGLLGGGLALAGGFTSPAVGVTAAAGAALGGTIGGAIGLAVDTFFQMVDKASRDNKLDDCRASYTCDAGKATSDGIEGCTCAEDDNDPTDPDSCAGAKGAADEIKNSSNGGNSKDGNDPTAPGGLSCSSDTDCPLGWRCDTQSNTCAQY